MDSELLVSGSVKLTAQEFFDLAERFAAWLEPEVQDQQHLIAIDLDPELHTVLTFSCFLLGVPSCTFRDDLQLLQSVDCTIVVTGDPERYSGQLKKIIMTEQTLEFISKLDTTLSPASVDDQDVCNVFFSSGTTGSPKAIHVRVGDLMIRQKHVNQWRVRDSYMSLLGMGAFSGFMTMFAQIQNLRTCYLSKNPSENAKLIRSEKIKSLFLSPLQLQSLLEEYRKRGIPFAVEELQVTGTSLKGKLKDRVEKLQVQRLTEIYGSTEGGLAGIGTGQNGRMPDYLEILDDVRLQIVDIKNQPSDEGMIGRVRIQSPGMASGYINSPTSSKEAFNKGCFYPGDEGYLLGGRLYLTGRSSEMINFGGVKINPSEMDSFVLGLGSIEDAAVFMVRTEGQIEQPALAFVSKNPPSPSAIRDQIAKKFHEGSPEYYFRVSEIPRNELGKPMRNFLSMAFEDRLQEDA